MRRRGLNRKGTILIENVVFLILNVIFLSILILFITLQGSGLIILEQSYAKQTALIIDSAKPGMVVFLDFEKGFNKIKENFGESYDIKNNLKNDIIRINDNVVTIKLNKDAERKGYSYSFFNEIELKNYYIDIRDDRQGIVFIF